MCLFLICPTLLLSLSWRRSCLRNLQPQHTRICHCSLCTLTQSHPPTPPASCCFYSPFPFVAAPTHRASTQHQHLCFTSGSISPDATSQHQRLTPSLASTQWNRRTASWLDGRTSSWLDGNTTNRKTHAYR